jgi:hypothetical protein
MGIPSGSGSEVLKNLHFENVVNADVTAITGVEHHIYTILSIIIANPSSSAAKTFDIWFRGRDTLGSANNENIYIVLQQSVGAYETYVWNDKFTFDGFGDNGAAQKLFFFGTAGDPGLDFHLTYIDQDWS